MLKDKQIVWAIHQMEEDIGPVGPSLDSRTPFQYLVSVILSAQATDVSVNKVTPILFAKYPEPKDLMNANIEDVEQIIKSVGLFHNKAKNIIKTARIVHEELNDVVPETRKGIMALPGAGRKTANVVLSDVFNQSTFAVDTHVSAISKRLHFVDQKANPLQVEKKIVSVLEPEELHRAHHTMIEYGRKYSMKLDPAKETNQLIIACDKLNEENEGLPQK
ncbi:endonuclease III domain-containing protein [Companilactobacillus pabuli]|jgi:endonuclease-3|uniref:Endonuclease III n=1 Tax=Companilactobacillus pabuli TaxID=2714036 RepID=A0A7L7KXN6_9LACO|nr:endonuclease III [Companilactobacillus pabuli]AKP03887.1 endonuclease III [Companilactobacillus farciminis]AKS52192.1 endonuclease III [Companilactobacillus farciminis]MDG5113122.1 endonuclease III [Companilactobacillus pabuli]QMT84056.1 endonuclease III [Companilactobacillus pabuli]GAQ02015.1 endonuclease III [Companilactobacillus farciminis]